MPVMLRARVRLGGPLKVSCEGRASELLSLAPRDRSCR